jgi:hypothetical protein
MGDFVSEITVKEGTYKYYVNGEWKESTRWGCLPAMPPVCFGSPLRMLRLEIECTCANN